MKEEIILIIHAVKVYEMEYNSMIISFITHEVILVEISFTVQSYLVIIMH